MRDLPGSVEEQMKLHNAPQVGVEQREEHHIPSHQPRKGASASPDIIRNGYRFIWWSLICSVHVPFDWDLVVFSRLTLRRPGRP